MGIQGYINCVAKKYQMGVVRENNRERMLQGGRRYGANPLDMRKWVRRWEDVCTCPVVARKRIIKASIVGCDVSILRKSIMRKTSVQRKSGPATLPANVTMRATITKPALAGLYVVSPAFLF